MTNPEKPVIVTPVGGSVTTYGTMNPTFKVLDLDKELMVPTNMYSYYADLDKANESGQPTWEVLHDYIDEYEMPDLSPTSFRDLALRIFGDMEMAKKFRYNEHRATKHFHANQLDMYCYLATSEMHENNECLHSGGMSAYGRDFKLLSGKIMQYATDSIIGNWVHYSLGQKDEK